MQSCKVSHPIIGFVFQCEANKFSIQNKKGWEINEVMTLNEWGYDLIRSASFLIRLIGKFMWPGSHQMFKLENRGIRQTHNTNILVPVADSIIKLTLKPQLEVESPSNSVDVHSVSWISSVICSLEEVVLKGNTPYR